MSSLQLVNSINAKAVTRPSSPSKGLLYVEAQVNGKATNAMINMGTMHNFVSVEEVLKLELKQSKEKGFLKAINQATPMVGVADMWLCKLDDYQVVLELEFRSKSSSSYAFHQLGSHHGKFVSLHGAYNLGEAQGGIVPIGNAVQ